MRRPADAPPPRITRRGLMLLGLQFGVIGTLGWRMRDLQILQNEKYRLLAEENRINIRLLPPARGTILDRDGRLLAGNRQNYRIVMVREQAGDPAAVLARLATIIDLPQEARDRVLREMMARSAFVPVVVAEHLSWDDVVRVAANSPVLPGVEPEVGLSRFYPDGPSTAHVVGYVGPVSERDLEKLEDPDPVLQIPRFQIGKTGVEQRLEPLLRGHAGNQRIEVSAAGRVMRELGRTEGQSGRDVNLTIDAELQIYAMQRMERQSAAAVVIDVRNGDIMALASAPGFDPSSFVFGIRSGEWNALLNDEYRPLSNKTVAGTYPPGSTFKMCVALAALETGAAGPGDTVFCGGSTTLGRRRFHCWKHGGHGTVDMRRSLSQSCDVYYYEMARRVGPDAISAMAHKLGLGIAHDLPMPAVAEGNMPDAEWKKIHRSEKWTTGDSFNYGIGQGFTLASPLQLAVYTARIAGGRSIQPRLLRAVGGAPVEIPAAEPLAIAPRHLEIVRGGMFAVSNEGTAYRSRFVDPENLMAGKTGTSQVRNITAAERAAGVTRNEQLPWNRRDHALFVAFAPFDNPRYAIAQIVEHGGGGSAAAAPIARDILGFALYGGPAPLSAYPPEQRGAIEEERAARPPQSEPDASAAAPARDRA
ncbi:MAG TPA: penicillin-binding protein 2 [Amaricoccus sp.]|uniref:penicillin-binding protein 2 n=1 Tax=Amaricoccus sp. TaxID=1872485 RepID=UPI002D0C34A1|nr:penicillin-binding protein 2 [Amaricoccus sp.]HMQ92908.1 penicillin-binding protein 2 [Amaricoccus sp.]HMR52253.1 penicillin-binding protein 2 [Amaricoccus sp.]HMR58996.1 penicillin-binding protein 2 [Amaricoccus sp.]HMT99105.1 penicillin-binding protein 2 [Amaricoccus sp.]